MAREIIVELLDDVDGSPAEGSVSFGLDGASYEIDLNTANAQALRAALAPYIRAGRKHSKSGKVQTYTAVSDPSAIRAWAAVNGIECPGRGRIPQSVRDQFNAAH